MPSIKSTGAVGRNKGKPVTELQKALIFQTFAITNNKAETARQLGLSYDTVAKYLSQKAPEEIVAARKKMAIDLVGEFHDTTKKVIDSIHPEDLEVERYVNRFGEIKEVGPSLRDKAITIGILTEQQGRLLDLERKLDATADTGIAAPGDITAIVASLNGKLKNIQAYGIKIELNDMPGLTERVVQAAEAEVVEPEQPQGFDFDERK